MNNAEYSFTLDLQNIQSQITLEVNSGDTARRLLITLTNGGKSHKLAEGSMAVISAKKSNGKYLFNKCNIVNTDTASIIEYNFTKATTDTPGVMQCEILVADPTEKTIISPRFLMMVDSVINGNEVWSEDENTFISTAIANEEARVENELDRISNEITRQEAELKRKRTLDELTELIANLGSGGGSSGGGDTTELLKRIEDLEYAANGNLYQTVTTEGEWGYFQVKNALRYGVLEDISTTRVTKIKTGLPYDLNEVWDYWWSGYGFRLSDNSFKMPGMSGEGVRIPIEIVCSSSNVDVTVSYRSRSVEFEGEDEYGDALTVFGLYDENEEIIGAEAECGSTVTIPKGTTAKYIGISFNNSELSMDMVIEDLVVTVSDPTRAKLYDVREIPLPLDDDVIELRPNEIGFLQDAAGNRVGCRYKLTYKNKVTN